MKTCIACGHTVGLEFYTVTLTRSRFAYKDDVQTWRDVQAEQVGALVLGLLASRDGTRAGGESGGMRKTSGAAIRRYRGGTSHVDCVKLFHRLDAGLLTDRERALYKRVFGKSPEELHAEVEYSEPAGDIPMFAKRGGGAGH